MFYSLLPPNEAAFLYNAGYEGGGQKMKLYAVSWPIAASRPIIQNKTIAFPMPVRLIVSTPLEGTAEAFMQGALNKGELRLGNNYVLCRQGAAARQGRQPHCAAPRPHHLLRGPWGERKTLHTILQAP